MPLDPSFYNSLHDDDGTNTYGTFWDKAEVAAFIAAIDALRLDQVAAPTDVTTLNATTSAHGLLPKLPGGTTTFLRGDGTFATPSAGTPAAHAASHQPGGSDAMAVDAAAGTGSLRTLGTAGTSAAAGNDARLSDARTPTSHATSHKSGGSDAVKLDELAAPTDVTTLDASTSAHGLLSKLPGGSTNFLRADGAWAAPAGGGSADGAGVRQAFRGLHLRTHPDADVAASKVMLVHADEIVFDDGTRIATGLDRLVANIAASGAGGLDTGSEAASTWYECYAIRKSSDGTLNALLHRAKDYYLDQQQLNTPTSYRLNKATGNLYTKLAQSFQVSTAGPLTFIDIQLQKVGSPTGRVWLTVEANSGGDPSGTPLATSDKLDVSLFPTSMLWVRFVFRNPTTVAAATTYHFVLQCDYTASDTNAVQWASDNAGSGSYANGDLRFFQSGSWLAAANDATFKLYVTRNDTAVTMPSGYDQRAQVGWVYNDSGSNFVPFVQLNRHHIRGTPTYPVNGLTASVETLVDASVAVPPTFVVVDKWDMQNTGTFINKVTTLMGGGYTFGIWWTETMTNQYSYDGTPVLIEYQHFYASTTGGSATMGLGAFHW